MSESSTEDHGEVSSQQEIPPAEATLATNSMFKDAGGLNFWWKHSNSTWLPRVARQYASRKFRNLSAKRIAALWEHELGSSNATDTMPPDERITLPELWAAEVYTPINVKYLYDGLRRLYASLDGGEKVEQIVGEIQAARRRGEILWYNLPGIARGDGRLFRGPRRIDAPLPDRIVAIRPSVWCMTSTLTVVVAQFIIDENCQADLDSIIRRNYTNEISLRNGTVSMLYSDAVHYREISKWRYELAQTAARWFSDTLPGSFAQISSRQYPIVELILTKEMTPWELATGANDTFRDLMNLHGRFGFWQCDDHTNLRMNIALSALSSSKSETDLRHRMTLAMNTGPTVEANEHRTTALPMFDNQISGLVARWSLTALLGELEGQLSDLRDLAYETSHGEKPKNVEALRRLLLQIGIHNQLVTDDIVRFNTNGRQRNFDDIGFTYVEPSGGIEPTRGKAIEVLIRGQVDAANRLTRRENDLRELLGTTIELSAVAQNLRLQQRVLWLTVGSVVVAIAALIVAIQALP